METPPHCLKNVCRVCGKKLQAAKKKKAMVYACSSHQQGLQKAFSILAESDAEGVHPPNFCLACYVVIKRVETAALKGLPYRNSVELFEWKPHEPENCTVSLIATVMLDIHLHRCVNILRHWADHMGRRDRQEVGVALRDSAL